MLLLCTTIFFPFCISYLLHLRFFCDATTNNPALLYVYPQGEKGDIGPEGAKGERGEIGLKGKEGPPGHPGLIGVRVSASADSSKFNSLPTIRHLFVSIYNLLRFSSTRVRRVNLAKLVKEENQEKRFDASFASGSNTSNFGYLAVCSLVFRNGHYLLKASYSWMIEL